MLHPKSNNTSYRSFIQLNSFWEDRRNPQPRRTVERNLLKYFPERFFLEATGIQGKSERARKKVEIWYPLKKWVNFSSLFDKSDEQEKRAAAALTSLGVLFRTRFHSQNITLLTRKEDSFFMQCRGGRFPPDKGGGRAIPQTGVPRSPLGRRTSRGKGRLDDQSMR